MLKNTKNIKKCVCGNPIKSGELACPECSKDLKHIIAKRSTDDGRSIYTLTGKITLEEFIEYVRETGIGSVGNCAICGERYIWGGNNPSPMVEDEDARCCLRCNDAVISARINGIIRHHKKTCMLGQS